MRLFQVLVIALTLVFTTAMASMITLNGNINQFETTVATNSETRLEITINSLKSIDCENGSSLELPEYFKIGSGSLPGPNQTVLPTYTTLIAVPENAVLSVTVESDEFIEVADYHLAAVSEDDKSWVKPLSAGSGYYPEELVSCQFSNVG